MISPSTKVFYEYIVLISETFPIYSMAYMNVYSKHFCSTVATKPRAMCVYIHNLCRK